MPDNNLPPTMTPYYDMLGGFEPWQIRSVAFIRGGCTAIVVAYIDASELEVFEHIPSNVITQVMAYEKDPTLAQAAELMARAAELATHCAAHRRLLGYPKTIFVSPGAFR